MGPVRRVEWLWWLRWLDDDCFMVLDVAFLPNGVESLTCTLTVDDEEELAKYPYFRTRACTALHVGSSLPHARSSEV